MVAMVTTGLHMEDAWCSNCSMVCITPDVVSADHHSLSSLGSWTSPTHNPSPPHSIHHPPQDVTSSSLWQAAGCPCCPLVRQKQNIAKPDQVLTWALACTLHWPLVGVDHVQGISQLVVTLFCMAWGKDYNTKPMTHDVHVQTPTAQGETNGIMQSTMNVGFSQNFITMHNKPQRSEAYWDFE